MHLVTRVRCLRLLNTSSTTHDRVPGIGKELQTRETIEADHTLEHGAKGMKAGQSHSKEWKRRRQRSRSNDSKDIYTHKVKEHYRSRSRSTDSMDIHTNKEDYRSRTPSCSKARGSHSHMYSGFYSSDIVQRKHRPRSLSCSPVCSRKNCYKLSDTSPQKPCETSHSRSPYRLQWRITHKCIDTSPNKEYETSQSRSRSCSRQRETDKKRDTFPKEQCERS